MTDTLTSDGSTPESFVPYELRAINAMNRDTGPNLLPGGLEIFVAASKDGKAYRAKGKGYRLDA